MPEAALLVGEFSRQLAAVQLQHTVVGVAGVVLGHRVDQRRSDVGADAGHDERQVLVDDALQRDQRLGGLLLVVKGDQLEFLAERTALGVDVVHDELELLQTGIAACGERAGERIDVANLDGVVGGQRRLPRGCQSQQREKCDAERAQTLHWFPPWPPFRRLGGSLGIGRKASQFGRPETQCAYR